MGAISPEHTDTQGHCFFIYFDLTMFICLIHTSNIKPVPVNISHSQIQISLRSHHCVPELEHSSLSWARVSAFAYTYVTTNTRTSLKLPLNAANLWMWHEDLPVWRACTIHPMSRFASLLRLIIFKMKLLHPQCLLAFSLLLQHHLADPRQPSKKSSCSLYTLGKGVPKQDSYIKIQHPRQQRGVVLILYEICLSLKSILMKKFLHKWSKNTPKLKGNTHFS